MYNFSSSEHIHLVTTYFELYKFSVGWYLIIRKQIVRFPTKKKKKNLPRTNDEKPMSDEICRSRSKIIKFKCLYYGERATCYRDA